jgi:hypothetical protein
MMYSGSQNGEPTEVTNAVNFDQALEKYKEFVGDATNVVVIVKEGLTSQELVSHSK